MFHIFGSLAEFERDLNRERTMPGLAAARRRGRVGARPSVMTEAKTKQAARMVKAGTPLTEVAEVLGVSRTTLYRHLKTTRPDGGAPPSSLPPVVVPVPPVMGERSARACPSCRLEPSTRAEAMQLRADLAVLWLHPDLDSPGSVVKARHCRSCQPRGPVVDVECTRCGDGPIITGALAQDSAPGSVAYPSPTLARRGGVDHRTRADLSGTLTPRCHDWCGWSQVEGGVGHVGLAVVTGDGRGAASHRASTSTSTEPWGRSSWRSRSRSGLVSR